ncbi:hypothetical protein EAI_15545 [Harpegnathos saltator]|uniref:Vitellogenin receptor n=1 Tax=Harpegnathos saltator TaxID=610380 RepID=E2CA89_HARSA|nr:hypothetical protein EAI_15545 [Harpegnathos saltator]
MLVCRRLLLIAAAIAASIEAGSASYSGISSDYSGYPSYAVYSGATSSESSSSSSSSSTTGPTSDTANGESLCRPSEFQCGIGHCVAQDKYCDGENDCDDKADEPRYCTREYQRSCRPTDGENVEQSESPG